MKRISIISAAILLVLFILGACAPKAEAPPGAPAKEVKIAFITDVTGPQAIYLSNGTDGSVGYLDYVNEEKGGIDGVKLDVTIYDIAGSAGKVKEAQQRAKEDGSIAVLSNVTQVTEAALDTIAANRMPQICGNPGVAGLWSDWVYPCNLNTLHDIGANLLDGTLAIWEEEGKPGKPVVGLVVQSTMSGALFALGFAQPCDGYEVPYAEVKGVEIITEKFAVDSTDLTPQMARLKDAGAEKFLIGAGSSNAVAALKAMKVLGLDPKDAMIAFITASSDLITLADPELIENVYIQSTLWSGLAAPGGKQPQIMPLAAELWEKKHAGEPLHDVFLYGMITAMVAEEAIGLALEEVSADELTSETLKEHGLNRITDFTADGLLAEPGITWRAGVGNHDGPCSWFIWQFREGYNHLVFQQETCPYIKCTIK
jgi:branched-chain amino acid transport system substrate-binding protein